MKIATAADVKAHLGTYLNEIEHGPVIVTRNGKAVAALLPFGDEEDLERLATACSPRVREILRAARERISAGTGVQHAAFWQDVAATNDRELVRARKRPAKKPA